MSQTAQPAASSEGPSVTSRQLVSLRQLLVELSISKATGYRWIEAGLLPVPIKLGPKKIAFVREEVDAILANRPRAQLRNLPAVRHTP